MQNLYRIFQNKWNFTKYFKTNAILNISIYFQLKLGTTLGEFATMPCVCRVILHFVLKQSDTQSILKQNLTKHKGQGELQGLLQRLL